MPQSFRRTVVVVLDGLRPDAIALYDLAHLRSLCASSAHTLRGLTVEPSVTVAAIASLLTGVGPSEHGMRSDHIALPRGLGSMRPLPALLREHGVVTRTFLGSVPRLRRTIATRLADLIGVTEASFTGECAEEIVSAALPALTDERGGLVFMHWTDADRAGHEHGWMSRPYGRAAQALDSAMGALLAEVAGDPDTLLIALADHGGGGVELRDHNSSHPRDLRIPLFVYGRGVRPMVLPAAHLLDVAPTVAWSLGASIPTGYRGRVLSEAFVVNEQLIEAAA